MGLRITMGLEGETELDRVLGISADGVKDFTDPLEDSKKIILDRVEQNFDARGAIFGGWAPRKKEVSWPLLEKTGAMRKAFDGSVTGNQLTVTNDDKKFKYHQSNQPRKKIPRRVMLKIDDVSATLIVKAFQEYIVNLLRK